MNTRRGTLRMAVAAAALWAARAAWAWPATHQPGVAQGVPLPGARLQGEGMLRFWGIPVYRARLWAPPNFLPQDYAAQPLALELEYLRAFDGEAIAQRSLQEMQRVQRIGTEQRQRWQQALRAVLPNVKSGDRLLGLHRPGVGAQFMQNGQVLGEVADPEFSRLFFGIWLSEATAEPALRAALLGQVAND